MYSRRHSSSSSSRFVLSAVVVIFVGCYLLSTTAAVAFTFDDDDVTSDDSSMTSSVADKREVLSSLDVDLVSNWLADRRRKVQGRHYAVRRQMDALGVGGRFG